MLSILSSIVPIRRLANVGSVFRVAHSRLQEILVVFAHPDDETMFFLPLIVAARRLGVKVRLLCLTNGDYDGLGKVRSKEFERVVASLNVESADIMDDPRVMDGPVMWNPKVVGSIVELYLKTHPQVGSIFTFDNYGVSGHPNHMSVYEGVQSLKGVSRYALTSVSIWRKYLPLLDFWVTWLTEPADSLVFMNINEPFLSLETMKLYGSQNVWFRKLFSTFSRYSYLNTYTKIV